MKKTLLVSALVALSSLSGLAVAVTATGSFDVKLKVLKACSVSAGNAIDFGSVASSSTTDIEKNTTISVVCSNKLSYNIGLTSTNNSGDNTGLGKMAGATSGNNDKPSYQLRQNTGTGPIWGSSIGTNTVAATGDGKAQSRTVYATLLGSRLNVQADDYSDKVTVTVTY